VGGRRSNDEEIMAKVSTKLEGILFSHFAVSKLLELHGEGGKGSATAATNADGVVVERPDGYEPPVLASV
jgi:hypothetical protein